MCDVVFDKPFVGASSLDGLCKERHGYRIPQYALLKLAKYAKSAKTEAAQPQPIKHRYDLLHLHDVIISKNINIFPSEPPKPAINVMEKLAKANAMSKVMPKQAATMVKNSGAGGAPANLGMGRKLQAYLEVF